MDENRKGVPRAMDTFVLMFCRLVTLPEGSPVFRELDFSPVVTVMHRGGTNSGGRQEVGIQSVHGGRCSGESGLNGFRATVRQQPALHLSHLTSLQTTLYRNVGRCGVGSGDHVDDTLDLDIISSILGRISLTGGPTETVGLTQRWHYERLESAVFGLNEPCRSV